MTTHRILILGGTTEARELAAALGRRTDFAVTLSLAGRTREPVAQPVPVRVGGFGGAEGQARYLREHAIDLLIDATHPHAAQISANAAAAANAACVRLIALRRPAWQPVDGDRWTLVGDSGAAVPALGATPKNVFLALGRQEVAPFEAAPQHDYVIRSVDPIAPPLALPRVTYLLGRGPFSEADDLALLEAHRINVVVAKNSGGAATYGKIAAARRLGLEVVLIRPPELPNVDTVPTVEAALAAIDHLLGIPSDRGE